MTDRLKLCQLAELLNLKLVIDNEVDYLTFYKEADWDENLENAIKKKITIKLGKLNLISKCSRCNGTGKYSYNARFGSMCFRCKGLKYEVPNFNNIDRLISTIQLRGA